MRLCYCLMLCVCLVALVLIQFASRIVKKDCSTKITCLPLNTFFMYVLVAFSIPHTGSGVSWREEIPPNTMKACASQHKKILLLLCHPNVWKKGDIPICLNFASQNPPSTILHQLSHIRQIPVACKL